MFKLNPQLNKELKHPLGELHSSIPSDLKSSELIATIGDISTLNVFTHLREPDISIVDYKTQRLNTLTEGDLKIFGIDPNIIRTEIEILKKIGLKSKQEQA